MSRAIGYVRVSTDQQVDSGLGLDAQRRAIGQAAIRLNLTVAATHQDAGLSGIRGIEDRPGLLDAVNALKRGDVLLIAKRDRLGRDVVAVARRTGDLGARTSTPHQITLDKGRQKARRPGRPVQIAR